MRCVQAQKLLSYQRDGHLAARDAQALADHLKTCAGCRALRQEFESAAVDLNALAFPLPETGSAHRAVMAWQARVERSSPFRKPIWAVQLALASAIIATTAGVILWAISRQQHHGDQLRQYSSSSAVVQNTEKGGTDTRQSVTRPDRPSLSALPEQRNLFLKGVDNFHQLITIRNGLALKHPSPRLGRGAGGEGRRADDLAYLNTDESVVIGDWMRMPPDVTETLMQRLQRSVHGGDDFVKVSIPPIAGAGSRAIQAAVAAYKQEAAIVDTRLQRRVTLGVKGMALSDLCAQLREQTGIYLTAGPSVADDKITMFCTNRPLRDIMREINRLFGFLWLRDGKEGAFTYLLVQDMRSQLLEEEMRNRDRDAALLALDREMERYRKYLGLSPEQAKQMAANAPREDANALKQLAGAGWAAAHLYFSLTPDQQAALLNGQQLNFGDMGYSGELPLPAEMRANALNAMGDVRLNLNYGSISLVENPDAPGLPPSKFAGAHATADLSLGQSELGTFYLNGGSGVVATDAHGESAMTSNDAVLAVGINPATASPDNSRSNANLANTALMSRYVSIKTEPSCRTVPYLYDRYPRPEATMADVMEALHKATGRDIIADYYTHVYSPSEVTVLNVTLFDALNQLGDRIHKRWKLDGNWLAFRSVSFFNERPKEIPNRLLARWAESHKRNGMLSLNDLVEVAQLSDIQLNSGVIADGVKAIYGLNEWEWVRSPNLLKHWRMLADFSPEMLEAVAGPDGVTFDQMTLAQQQRYVALTFGPSWHGRLRLDDFAGASLRVKLPDPSVLTAVPEGNFDPMSYGPKFIYRYGRPHTVGTLSEIGPNSMQMSQIPAK